MSDVNKTSKVSGQPLAEPLCSVGFPSLREAMQYAQDIEGVHDCFADRAAIVLWREVVRLRETGQKRDKCPKKGDIVTVCLGGRIWPNYRILSVVETPEGVQYHVNIFGDIFVTADQIVG